MDLRSWTGNSSEDMVQGCLNHYCVSIVGAKKQWVLSECLLKRIQLSLSLESYILSMSKSCGSVLEIHFVPHLPFLL